MGGWERVGGEGKEVGMSPSPSPISWSSPQASPSCSPPAPQLEGLLLLHLLLATWPLHLALLGCQVVARGAQVGPGASNSSWKVRQEGEEERRWDGLEVQAMEGEGWQAW